MRLLFPLLLLGLAACDAADHPPSSDTPISIHLSEMVVKGRLIGVLAPSGELQHNRLIAARLDIPAWMDYFYPDGSTRPSPAGYYRDKTSFKVWWSISQAGQTENLLINNLASGRFIAATPEGLAQGANRLPIGAFAFFVAQGDLAGGDYYIQAELTDGGSPVQRLGKWKRDFRLADAFSFPESFSFKVRGVALLNIPSADRKVYPAPFTGVYPITITQDLQGGKSPDRAEATVYLTKAATGFIFYYDFISLVKGYTIDYYSKGVEVAEPAVAADPTNPNSKPLPKILRTTIMRRSDVNVETVHLPAAQEDYTARFTAEAGSASGRVTLLVRDARQQTGELTVYLRSGTP